MPRSGSAPGDCQRPDGRFSNLTTACQVPKPPIVRHDRSARHSVLTRYLVEFGQELAGGGVVRVGLERELQLLPARVGLVLVFEHAGHQVTGLGLGHDLAHDLERLSHLPARARQKAIVLRTVEVLGVDLEGELAPRRRPRPSPSTGRGPSPPRGPPPCPSGKRRSTSCTSRPPSPGRRVASSTWPARERGLVLGVLLEVPSGSPAGPGRAAPRGSARVSSRRRPPRAARSRDSACVSAFGRTLAIGSATTSAGGCRLAARPAPERLLGRASSACR